jgi:hypothetical protein
MCLLRFSLVRIGFSVVGQAFGGGAQPLWCHNSFYVYGLATVPGYPAAVRVGTAPKTAVFWPGFAYCRASLSQTQNFGSN